MEPSGGFFFADKLPSPLTARPLKTDDALVLLLVRRLPLIWSLIKFLRRRSHPEPSGGFFLADKLPSPLSARPLKIDDAFVLLSVRRLPLVWSLIEFLRRRKAIEGFGSITLHRRILVIIAVQSAAIYWMGCIHCGREELLFRNIVAMRHEIVKR
jgi:hypothetical protein